MALYRCGDIVLSGMNRPYKLTHIWTFDSRSKTITNVPSGTDFIILVSLWFDPVMNTDSSITPSSGQTGVAENPIVTVTEIGKSATADVCVYGTAGKNFGRYSTTITWTDATTVTASRSATGGGVIVYSAEYVD